MSGHRTRSGQTWERIESKRQPATSTSVEPRTWACVARTEEADRSCMPTEEAYGLRPEQPDWRQRVAGLTQYADEAACRAACSRAPLTRVLPTLAAHWAQFAEPAASCSALTDSGRRCRSASVFSRPESVVSRRRAAGNSTFSVRGGREYHNCDRFCIDSCEAWLPALANLHSWPRFVELALPAPFSANYTAPLLLGRSEIQVRAVLASCEPPLLVQFVLKPALGLDLRVFDRRPPAALRGGVQWRISAQAGAAVLCAFLRVAGSVWVRSGVLTESFDAPRSYAAYINWRVGRASEEDSAPFRALAAAQPLRFLDEAKQPAAPPFRKVANWSANLHLSPEGAREHKSSMQYFLGSVWHIPSPARPISCAQFGREFVLPALQTSLAQQAEAGFANLNLERYAEEMGGLWSLVPPGPARNDFASDFFSLTGTALSTPATQKRASTSTTSGGAGIAAAP